MTGQLLDQLSSRLFEDEDAQVYAILDGASIADLLSVFDRLEPVYECLYRGNLEPDMQQVAPYLVYLESDSEFAEWVLESGWGKHWGVFAIANCDLATMRRHLRRFLIVHDESGKPLYFRFYDPRVLRIFLPTCTAAELKTMFGPVARYIYEDESPDTSVTAENGSGGLVLRQHTLVSGKES